MDRFRSSTHWEVRYHALRTLAAWGDSAGPYLIRAAQPGGEPYRLVGAAEGLAAIKHPQAAELIAPLLALYADDTRRFRSDFIDALGDTGDPSALAILIPTYQRHGNQLGNALAAIGKCGGVDFLLEQLNQTTEPEAIRKLIWPLAYTQSARAAAALSKLLQHPNGKVRLRARSAMSQSMGSEVVNPLLALLTKSGDEYLISGAINQILARGRNRGNPELVHYLNSMIQHPTLGWEARYALAQLGSTEAREALINSVGRLKPEQVMEHLDYMGDAALPILHLYNEHPHPGVRRQALFKAEAMLSPATRPLMESMLNDADPANRELARQALYRLDRLDLLRSFADHLPQQAGKAVWSGFRRDLRWNFDSGYSTVLRVFSIVHWVGLGISGFLGLVLIFNRARIFNSYRFNLLVSFLLAQGMVGNFFLLGSDWQAPERIFRWALGVHLLLLIGTLCQEQHNRPGDLRNRFDRLGGASLWLLTPPLLFLGTPVIAEGMRLILRDWANFQFYVGFAAITTLLVIEKAALPGRLMPRSWRFEQGLSLLLNTAQLLLFIWPLLLAAQYRHSMQDENGAVLALILLVPLLWLYALRLVHSAVFARTRHIRLPLPPDKRFDIALEGDRISVWPRRDVSSWRLGLRAGLVSAALFGLIIEGFTGQVLLQVQANAMRAGMTHFGLALGGGEWRYRPVLNPNIEEHFRNAEGQLQPFAKDERDWLNALREATNKHRRDQPSGAHP